MIEVPGMIFFFPLNLFLNEVSYIVHEHNILLVPEAGLQAACVLGMARSKFLIGKISSNSKCVDLWK